MIRRALPFLMAASVLVLSSPTAFSRPESSPESSVQTGALSSDLRARVNKLYERGNRLLKSKRYAEAERSFLDALKLAPDVPAIHHGLGMVYIQTQDHELAVLHLEGALKHDPDHVKVLYALSKAYTEIGEFEKAKDGYLRAIRSEPGFEAAHQGLAGIYYREKKWEEALASLDRAKAINPRSAHTLMLIGLTAIRAGRQDIALDAVTELRQTGSQDRARRLEYLIYSANNEGMNKKN